MDPYRPFRPVGGRIVPLTVAVCCVVIFTVLAFVVPLGGHVGWTGADRVLVIGLGLVFAAVLWRFAQVRAIPDREGLEVHNLMVSRRVEWAEVVEVQFGGGSPWVTLELNDFTTLAVMGIQRSDGPRAQAEAGRLAALVQAHSGQSLPPGA
ncbi:PH domain-containing protein [Dermacoccaceae bacterium W4C1]